MTPLCRGTKRVVTLLVACLAVQLLWPLAGWTQEAMKSHFGEKRPEKPMPSFTRGDELDTYLFHGISVNLNIFRNTPVGGSIEGDVKLPDKPAELGFKSDIVEGDVVLFVRQDETHWQLVLLTTGETLQVAFQGGDIATAKPTSDPVVQVAPTTPGHEGWVDLGLTVRPTHKEAIQALALYHKMSEEDILDEAISRYLTKRITPEVRAAWSAHLQDKAAEAKATKPGK